MKRMFSVLIGTILVLAALHSQAQFIGYTSQQSVTSTPYNAISCLSAVAGGIVTVPNLGQGQHSITLTGSTGGLQTLLYVIQGSYDGSTFFDISDDGTGTANSVTPTTLSGTGYYPVVGVKIITCSPNTATITMKYSGISLTPGQPVGSVQTGQQVKNLALAASAGSNLTSVNMRSPFGSSGGLLQFFYGGGAGPAGSTLQVFCGTNNLNVINFLSAFPLQTTLSLVQTIAIPPATCPWFAVSYTSGGASASTFTLDYAFTPPGVASNFFQYRDITSNTNTQVKTGAGTLHLVTVNNAGSTETLTLFDGTSCAGTKIGTTGTLAAASQTLFYDVQFLAGLCVTSAGTTAGDYTVSFQ